MDVFVVGDLLANVLFYFSLKKAQTRGIELALSWEPPSALASWASVPFVNTFALKRLLCIRVIFCFRFSFEKKSTNPDFFHCLKEPKLEVIFF